MRRIELVLGIAALAFVAVPLVSQAQLQNLSFEVATIKLHSLEQDHINGFGVHGGSCHGVDSQYPPGGMAPPALGRCVIHSLNLRGLISVAYKVSVDGGPDWASSS